MAQKDQTTDGYLPLSSGDAAQDDIRAEDSLRRQPWRIASALAVASLLWWLWAWALPCARLRTDMLPEAATAVPSDHVPEIGLPDSVLRRWAQYAPYIPVEEYAPPPRGCAVAQVNLLQRHGARWPTSGAGAEMKAAVDKLQGVKEYKEDYLSFLKEFTWHFGTEDLLPFGAKQSYESGHVTFDRYAPILADGNPPFVRTADSTRVVDSATNWTAGFNTASHKVVKATVDLILPESGNLTLDDGMCPNSGDGDTESARWLAIYAPRITKRLNSAAPGANLTDDDTHSLMSLCAFHSQITIAPSPFCGLFTDREFEGYEYFADVNKFYGNGYGGNLGPVQGVGYVNELLARLTNQSVQDHTQTNRTLDASPKTFPLNRAIYVDFSHDNTMVAVYSALGLFKQILLSGQKLDPIHASPLRTWVLSKMVPFSARVVVEKLECTGPVPLPAGTFVRILVNDAVQPLEFCGGVGGICALDSFVKSQRYARHDGDGDFEKCYE